MKINNIKKDKKYLEGIPLIPEPEINESDPTYYYYKVFFIFLEMGLAYISLGMYQPKGIMQLFK